MARTDTHSPAHADGIAFPTDSQGRRSTLASGRQAFASALRAASEESARQVESETQWRTAYPAHVRRMVELGVGQTRAAEAMAVAGLEALHGSFEFWRGGQRLGLRQAMSSYSAERLGTVTIRGSSRDRPELAVPYRGRLLAGDELKRALDDWVARGVAEPSFAQAIGVVADHPDWLDLSDWHVAALGAGAELGPFAVLSRWRANIAAIDVPGAPAWAALIDQARRGNATVRLPAAEPCTADDPRLPAKVGANLLTQTPEIRTWLAALPGPMAVGAYAYLDGEAHVRVALAMDAIIADLIARRGDVVPACLLSPTDVFAVPQAAAEAAMRGWLERGTRGWTPVLRAVSGGRLFAANIQTLLGDDGALRCGIVDGLVLQQGPNYALAKRLQQWRALDVRARGGRVSAKVAPATRTRSVVKNRALAAAYAGAHHFGVEVFEPATANALMAALLVHDLRTGGSAAAGAQHPLELFMNAALHGGLWRLPYAPRSALPVAALAGWFARSR